MLYIYFLYIICLYVCVYLHTLKGKMQREHGQALSSGAQCQDQKQWAQTVMDGPLSEKRGILCDCEGGLALAQIDREVVKSPSLGTPGPD